MDEGQVEEFLAGLDYGLLAYKDEFLKSAVTSEATLRFLRPNEVREMKIPKVYQRLLIAKIIELQTPESKGKLKRDAASPCQENDDHRSTGLHPPKRLNFQETRSQATPSRTSSDAANKQTPVTVESLVPKANCSSDAMEKEISRLSEERNDLQAIISSKKEDLNVLKSRPVQPHSLPIPGLPVINVACDNCHHKGHRASGNRGGTQCPYVKCPGFHYCGLEGKHKEHRQQVFESEKEVQTLEKKVKLLNAEIDSVKSFLKYNNTSFITAVRPKLLAANAGTSTYKGKDGTQNLNRDLRFIKIATGGKIPSACSRDDLQQLINKGKTKVSSVCDPFDDANLDSNNNTEMDCKKGFMSAQIQTMSCFGSPYANFYPMMYSQPSQQAAAPFGVYGMYPYQSNVSYGAQYRLDNRRPPCETAPNPNPPLPSDEPQEELKPPLPPSAD